MKEDKAGKDFWDKVWKENPFLKYLGIEKYWAMNKKLDKLFTRFLEKGNFKDSLYFTLSKILGKEKRLLETHNLSIMDKKRLNELLQSKEIEISTLDYFGPIDLTMIGIEIKPPISYLAYIINQLLGYSTFFIPKSRYFSPHLVLIAEKMK